MTDKRSHLCAFISERNERVPLRSWISSDLIQMHTGFSQANTVSLKRTPNTKKWFALGYKTHILFKKYHEDKRNIPSFPQSVLLLLVYWSKLTQLYFGNIVVLEIVLTEEANWNFLFCTRQIFPFKHVSVANSIGNIKTEALTPNSPVYSTSCAWLCSYQIHCKTQGPKLCPSLGVEHT